MISLSPILSPVIGQTHENFGYLKIQTDSSKIEIHINNKSIGYTPLPIIALQPGDYIVSATHPNPYLWGNLDWQDSIQIIPGDTIIIQPEFKTIFSIRTNPFGASVFLNDEFKGNTPLSILLNSHKNYRLLVKKDGFKDYLVDQKQIKNNFLNLNLVQNHIQLDLNEFEQQKHRKAKHRYRAVTYSLWGLSILTGLSTVYLKDQADDKYQQYLVAGSLSEMNKYYNEAKKYDRYTYISVGVLQGFFVLSFYFLLKSL
jgi:hypothetical protein